MKTLYRARSYAMAASKVEEEAGDGLTIASTITLNDGRKMPAFGLGVRGCVCIPRAHHGSHVALRTQVWRAEPKPCKAAVLAALKHGYRHIDTAKLCEFARRVWLWRVCCVCVACGDCVLELCA